jgi:ribosomal protein L40E
MRSDKNIREKKRSRRPHLRPRADEAESRMHQITFCVSCEEAIPVHALLCFRCGAKQPGAERALQVVFCEKCGSDYPARAMACFHCGHLNPRHPYLKGRYAS